MCEAQGCGTHLLEQTELSSLSSSAILLRTHSRQYSASLGSFSTLQGISSLRSFYSVMADPVSGAGTAVGVISLGIQVCQGLMSYYENWKSFDDDIAHLYAKSNKLRITLENLEYTLPKLRHSNANVMTDVEEKIVSSLKEIGKLEKALNKCRSSVSANTIQQKGYRLLQKTFYPFKKATIQELENNVTDLEHNLKTSLHSLTL